MHFSWTPFENIGLGRGLFPKKFLLFIKLIHFNRKCRIFVISSAWGIPNTTSRSRETITSSHPNSDWTSYGGPGCPITIINHSLCPKLLYPKFLKSILTNNRIPIPSISTPKKSTLPDSPENSPNSPGPATKLSSINVGQASESQEPTTIPNPSKFLSPASPFTIFLSSWVTPKLASRNLPRSVEKAILSPPEDKRFQSFSLIKTIAQR